MLNDLLLVTGDPIQVETDVCIVGGGTAGLFLAHLLQSQGVRCVLLEGGGEASLRPPATGHHCEQRGAYYRGAEAGRSFGMGGTSVLWGGQMLPPTRWELADRAGGGFDPWPVSYDEVSRWFPAVARALRLSEDCFDQKVQASRAKKFFPLLASFGSDFELALSTWLPFATRNFAQVFSGSLSASPRVSMWVNASVVGMTPSAARDRIVAVTAKGPRGSELHVQARLFALCAGALESTRLLLAHDEATEGSITRTGAPLGWYFQDHLSASCGRLICTDKRSFNLEVAPIFADGLMRTPRLLLSEEAQRRFRSASAFAHFTFKTHGDSGFDFVRSLLRRCQGEQLVGDISVRAVSDLTHDISALAYYKYFHRRLWIPDQADLFLQVDIEQTPNRGSRIALSDKRDEIGRKNLLLDWRIGERDLQLVREVAQAAAVAWKNSRLSQLAELHLSPVDAIEHFDSMYDVYHPTGTLRMGYDDRNSVVDADLRIWAARNCFVSSTAVFPSAGSANPGLTQLALTARLAAHMGCIIKEQGG